MPISDDDLDACFSTDDFAVPAVFEITPADPPAPAVTVTVNGYFTEAHEVVDHNQAKTVTAAPTFTCRTSEITQVAKGMSVTIAAVAYTVARIWPLGAGLSDVYLKT
jgi:hypothetical protein